MGLVDGTYVNTESKKIFLKIGSNIYSLAGGRIFPASHIRKEILWNRFIWISVNIVNRYLKIIIEGKQE